MNLFNFAYVNEILLHLHYLLRHHDCIVLPGWGALVCYDMPALYDEKKGISVAPSRQIRFNTDITADDGILSTSLSRKESISYHSATSKINRQVEEWKESLNQIGHIDLDGIGRFLKLGKNISFIPSTSDFAYNPYRIYSLEDKKVAVKVEKKQIGFIARKFVKVAIMIAIVISFATMLIEPLSNLPNIVKASILSINNEPSIEFPEALFNDNSLDYELLFLCAPKSHSLLPQNGNHYGIIVASFDSMEQAERFISQNPLEELGISFKENHYRVYAYSDKSKERLISMSITDDFKNRWPSSWVARID